MKTDKPTPPEGYEVMLGKDVPRPVSMPGGILALRPEKWEVATHCIHMEWWYAVPVRKPQTLAPEDGHQAHVDSYLNAHALLSANTDPKKSQGEKKPQLQLIPPALNVATAQALQNGATKYGAWNWRDNQVEVMTYLGAMKRHIDQFLNGEDIDPDTGAHHLGHIAANCGILLDADKHGMLVDNRPGTKQTA